MGLLSKTLSWVRYVFCFPLLTLPSSQPKDLFVLLSFYKIVMWSSNILVGIV